MKISIRSISLFFLFSAFSLPLKSIPNSVFPADPNKWSYQTECVEMNSSGTLKVKIWDTKKGRRYKPHLARINAIHAILYSGIQGSNCGNQRAILNNEEFINKFKAIEENFFHKKGDWGRFTRGACVETTMPETIGKKDWKVYEVTINKKELLDYLKNKKITKTLNDGF